MPPSAKATVLSVTDTNSTYGFKGTLNVGSSTTGGLSQVVTATSITLTGSAYGAATNLTLDNTGSADAGDSLCLSGATTIVTCAFSSYATYDTFFSGGGYTLSFLYLNNHYSPGEWTVYWSTPVYGQGIGTTFNPDEITVAIQPTDAPEPATLALLAAGLVGLAIALKRKKAHRVC